MKRAVAPINPKEFLATAGAGRTLSKYRKNGKIFAQGEQATAVFYILAGEVKLTVVSEQGRVAVIGILAKDEFFGEGCLTGQPKRMATATSIHGSEILKISRDVMLHAMRTQPALSHFVMSHVLTRSIRVEADLVDQLFNSSEKRLARALLLLANFGKEGKPEPIITKVTQETLAEMIGTTRSRVSLFMNKFRKMGFIAYNGTIEVHSSLLSVVLADQPAIHKEQPKTNK